MNKFFKVFSLVFAVLFIWAAFVQWNDPDTFFWILIYALAALLSVLFFLDCLSFGLGVAMAIAYLAGVFLSWPDQFEGFTIGQGDITNIEEGREAFGLLICGVVLLVYALRVRYARRLKL